MDEKETGRLEAFSDGVFAVAITLLVLNIKIPDIRAAESNEDIWRALLGQWPMLIAYTTSFATIGIMWINHHRLFQHIKRSDTGLLLLNLLLLLIIVFIPVPTALISEALPYPAQNAPAILYGGTSLAMALCFNLLWRYASYHDRLLSKNVDQHSVNAISRQYAVGPLLYIIALALAFINVLVFIVLTFLLALFFALPSQRLRTIPTSEMVKEEKNA